MIRANSDESFVKSQSTQKIFFNKLGCRIFFYTKELNEWLRVNSRQDRTMEDIVNENLSAMVRRQIK